MIREAAMAAAVAGWPLRRAAAQVCPRVAACARARPNPWRALSDAYVCVAPLRFLRHDSLPFPASLAPLPAGHPVTFTASSLRLARRVAPMTRVACRTASDAHASSRPVPTRSSSAHVESVNRAESSLSIGAARADPSPHGSSGTPRSC